MPKIILSAIAAMAQNRVIGKDNALIWHIPADLKYFKAATMGKPIIMGRKSFEALGKPLPGRPHIIISRKPAPENPGENVFFVPTIDEAVALGQKIAAQTGQDEIFITGGGEIYKQTLSRLDRLYLTLIHRDYEGDTHFPAFDQQDWRTLKEERHEGDPAFTFFVLEPR